MSVPVMGTTPGRRYGQSPQRILFWPCSSWTEHMTLQGHTMIFNKPLLIVFGGNNGQQACGDQGSAGSAKDFF